MGYGGIGCGKKGLGRVERGWRWGGGWVAQSGSWDEKIMRGGRVETVPVLLVSGVTYGRALRKAGAEISKTCFAQNENIFIFRLAFITSVWRLFEYYGKKCLIEDKRNIALRVLISSKLLKLMAPGMLGIIITKAPENFIEWKERPSALLWLLTH